VQAGQTSKAVALVAERVQDARAEFSSDSPELAAALSDNGKILLDAKAYADAEPLLLEAYRGLEKCTAQDVRLRDVLEQLVKLYDAWGKPQEAAKWRKKLAGPTSQANTAKR
jgi:tetratricopeptide (TPR) repeat protein